MKNFIKAAIKKPGALHVELGVPQGTKIPASKLAKAVKAKGKLGQRARFARTLGKIRSARGPRQMAKHFERFVS